MSIEVTMRSGIISPNSNIELDFDLSKMFDQVLNIDIALVLDLKIFGLSEPRDVIEHITKELGSESITREELLRNSDGMNLLYAFKMPQI